MMTLASRRLRNHSTLRHSSRNLPLKDSLVPFCHGLPGSMMRGLDARFGEPLQDRVAHELRTVVRAQEGRRAVRADQARQHVDHSARADAAGHVDRQALVGEFVDHRQTLELLAVGAGIEHEVVGPDVIGGPRRQRARPTGGNAPARTFARQAAARPGATADARD